MDLKSIPLDSDYWKNPPLPEADKQEGGWLSWCQQLAVDTLDKTRPVVVLADEGDLKHEGIRSSIKNDRAVEQARS